MNCGGGNPPGGDRDEDDWDEEAALKLSVGMQRCPEGAFFSGILVCPGASLISYPPGPGKMRASFPGVISKIAFLSAIDFNPSSAGRFSPDPSTIGHSNVWMAVLIPEGYSAGTATGTLAWNLHSCAPSPTPDIPRGLDILACLGR